MKLEEKTLEKEYIYNGKIINVRVDVAELPNGRTAKREVVEHPGGVAIVPLTDDMEVLLVKQFRYPYGEVIQEIPAGKLEKGEDPFESGKRELKEETGSTAEHYMDLGKFYPTPGYCGEIIHLYAAWGLSFGDQDLDEDEFLNVEKVPLEKLCEDIIDGKIRDGKTQTAILKTMALVKRGDIEIKK